MSFEIIADFTPVTKALEQTSLSMKSINRKILTHIGKQTVVKVKAGIRSTYSPPSKYYKRTGALVKAWTYTTKKDGSSMTVYPRSIYTGDAARKNRQWAAGLSSILSYGTSDGRIKPRSFIQKGESYAAGNSYMPDIQNIIDKELTKYWGN